MHSHRPNRYLLLILFLVFTWTCGGPANVWAQGEEDNPSNDLIEIGQVDEDGLAGYLDRVDVPEPTWAERLLPMVQAAEQDEAQVGLMVYDINSRRYHSYNAQELLTPASNIKLFTAAAALNVLGPDYRFRTVVAYDGQLDVAGKLTGNLILQGYGDPTLTTATLADWADSLVEAGLKEVTGDILVDASFFEEEGQSNWGWLIDEQNPVVGALSVNHNQIKLTVVPGKTAGAYSWIRVEPALAPLVQVVYNNVATVDAEQRASLKLYENESAVVVVEGRIPADSHPIENRATARSPGLYVGMLFRKLLSDRGVEFREDTGVKQEAALSDLHLLIEHDSEPLRRVLPGMLKNSDNLVSEEILRTLGAESLGLGSSEGGQRVIAHFLETAGLSTMPYVLCDGCGLRLDNRLSAELIVGLLVLMNDHPDGSVFRDALAVAGTDGTLAGRLKNASAEKRVHAKTGSLLGASALSGYITTSNEHILAFAILMNGPTERGWAWVNAMRRLQDDMVLEMLTWQ